MSGWRATQLRTTLHRALLLVLAMAIDSRVCADPGEQIDDMRNDSVASQSALSSLGVVAVPIPKSDPTFGTGLTVPVLFIYEPYKGRRPWTTGVAAMYTNNDSKATGFFQKAYLLDDRVQLLGGYGYFDLNLHYFGQGDTAATTDASVPMNQRGDVALVQGLYEIFPHLYTGLRYRWLSVDTSFDVGAETPVALPEIDLTTHVGVVGVIVQYDSRDSEFNPQRGIYATLVQNLARDAFGSQRDYEKTVLRANTYNGLGPGVLASRLTLCHVDGDAPFYDICSYGSSNDLRGYEIGRYRDDAMVAVQTEYRWRFYRRWGLVGFVGTGKTGAAFDDLNDLWLSAAGAGLRFEASTQYKMNISLDYARSRDGSSLYFYIGEAF